MTSAKKVEANRRNSRKSCGPRTDAGKLRSSGNAWRHGLSTIDRHNPAYASEIEQMASAIREGDDRPELCERAAAIAESEIVLRCVRTERIAMIERLRDISAQALGSKDHLLSQAKARFREAEIAHEELVALEEWLDARGERLGYATKPPDPLWRPPEEREARDDFDAMYEARKDLARLVRYERRAWSRRNRAIIAFIEAKVGPTPHAE